MAITYVNAQEESTNPGPHLTGSPNDITVDIGTRTNGLLVVTCSLWAGSTLNDSSFTYDGVSMSEAIEYNFTGNQWLMVYYLVNPSNGSNILAHTYNISVGAGFLSYYVCAHWYDGAYQIQGSILDQTETATGVTDPTDDITPTTDNQLVVSHYKSESSFVLKVGGNGTLILDHDFGARVTGCSYVIQTAAGTETMSWAGVDTDWAMACASFKEEVAAAGIVGPFPTFFHVP